MLNAEECPKTRAGNLPRSCFNIQNSEFKIVFDLMSYTVLARRYRSATFDEVIGQEQIAQTLRKAIETGRIAHAYLFCGARGTGKTSTARILAKCLNCLKHDSPTTKPCNKCDSCLGIARGDDLDVPEIDAASNTSVENVREIISNAPIRPARARFKVYIIDEVHMLSKSAFNALLKTLEEPPSHVKFILATTEPEKVPATILSRCQRFDFRNITTRQIAAHLGAICKQEKMAADEDALMLVARSAAGSMRDGLSLLERLLSVGEDRLTLAAAERLMGLPRWQSLVELAQAIGEADVNKTLSRAGALLAGGMSADALASALADHFRDLLVLRTCPAETDLVDASAVQLADIRKLAERFEPTDLIQDITLLEEVRRQMRQGHGGRALFDAALARLALSGQFTSISRLLGQVESRPTPAVEKKKSDEPAVSLPPVIVPPPVVRPPPELAPAAIDVPAAPPVRQAPPTRPVPAEPAAPVEAASTVKITPELTAQLEQDPIIGTIMRELGGRLIKVE
jgi:DNA polymerase III subunit gamma/tau